MQYWDRRPKALQLVGRAVESVRQIVTSAPLLLRATIAAYALVGIGVVHLSNHFPVSVAQEFDRYSAGQLHSLAYGNVLPLHLLQLVAEFPTAVISSLPCIIIIRHILLEEIGVRPPPLSILWPYAGWNFALEALILVLGQLQFFSFDAWGAFLVLTTVGLLLSILFSMVFPGIAIGINYNGVWDRARNGLQHLRGNFWLLVRTYLIIFIAIMIMTYLPYLPGFLFSNNPLEITPTSWIAISFDSLIMVTASCVTAGVVAWLYAWVAPPRFLENFD